MEPSSDTIELCAQHYLDLREYPNNKSRPCRNIRVIYHGGCTPACADYRPPDQAKATPAAARDPAPPPARDLAGRWPLQPQALAEHARPRGWAAEVVDRGVVLAAAKHRYRVLCGPSALAVYGEGNNFVGAVPLNARSSPRSAWPKLMKILFAAPLFAAPPAKAPPRAAPAAAGPAPEENDAAPQNKAAEVQSIGETIDKAAPTPPETQEIVMSNITATLTVQGQNIVLTASAEQFVELFRRLDRAAVKARPAQEPPRHPRASEPLFKTDAQLQAFARGEISARSAAPVAPAKKPRKPMSPEALAKLTAAREAYLKKIRAEKARKAKPVARANKATKTSKSKKSK